MTVPPPDQPPDDPPRDRAFLDRLAESVFPDLGPATSRRLLKVADTYDHAVARYGATARAALWFTRDSQERRFEVFAAALAALGLAAPVVNDLGCGYGPLFEYLVGARRGVGRVRRRPDLLGPAGRYVGYDISMRMLALAARRISDSRARFLHAARPDEPADVTFASGTFGVIPDTRVDTWTDYVRDLIHQMAAVSRHAIAFNLLDARAAGLPQGLYFADPAETVAWCRAEIDPAATLIDGYLPNDFTIVCRTDRRQ